MAIKVTQALDLWAQNRWLSSTIHSQGLTPQEKTRFPSRYSCCFAPTC